MVDIQSLSGHRTIPDTPTLTDELTSKTYVDTKAPTASPTFTGTATVPRLITPPVALTDAVTITTDAALGNHFRVTLAGNRTMGAPTNPTDGQKLLYEVKQDATGSRTVTWNAVFRFGTDVTSPTLTTTASKKDFIGFVYNSTDVKWDCLAVARGY